MALTSPPTHSDHSSAYILKKTCKPVNANTPRPKRKAAWQARLNIKDHVWEDAASRCTTTFLTPRDVHTHFKHIIHRALTTRERGLTPQYGTLCHSPQEPELWPVDRQQAERRTPAVRCAGSGRAPGYRAGAKSYL
eukprot:scaffold14861_cov124-Isochrysis_galbana.AAC.4